MGCLTRVPEDATGTASARPQWTSARVDSHLRVHILPYLGHRSLGSIRHTEVRGCPEPVRDPLPRFGRKRLSNLTALFRAAVRGRIVTVSPCEAVSLPKRTHIQVVPPTVEQVRELLSAMPTRYRVAGVLAAGAGLRHGEALGLTVDRVDFLRRQLRVDRQMHTPPRGEPHLAPPSRGPRPGAACGHRPRGTRRACWTLPPGADGLILTYHDGRPVRRNRFGAMCGSPSPGPGSLRTSLSRPTPSLRQRLIAGGCSAEGHPEGARSCERPGDAGHLRPPLAGFGRPEAPLNRSRARCSRGLTAA